jgi:hypothetical protein
LAQASNVTTSSEQEIDSALRGKEKDVMFIIQKLAHGTIERENTLSKSLAGSKKKLALAQRRIKEIDYQLPLIEEEIGVATKLKDACEKIEDEKKRNTIVSNLSKLLDKLEEDGPTLNRERIHMLDVVKEAEERVAVSEREYKSDIEDRHRVLKHVFAAKKLLEEIQGGAKRE